MGMGKPHQVSLERVSRNGFYTMQSMVRLPEFINLDKVLIFQSLETGTVTALMKQVFTARIQVLLFLPFPQSICN